ncbi:hypothetical protein [Rodentibacter pneumotropicus]|uniref:Uncharacterized protein n=1 Tax=Rodentibacter pneumotropicus TaxID=758 RepID=A0A4S2QJC7_9PAST|nr:hypothetical protein [Rodentibacter pneumotropicus]THA04368.1 hypothetical protein D3M77_10880 [Rodentibacter pneumotropicus]THA17381.1 hypothetical protein D3M76_01700 [Rodentibacter pneumotropicus]
MSFIPKSKKQLLAKGYTHYGKLWGIPVYIGDINSEAPLIETANFIPSWILDIADHICFSMLAWQNRDNPYYEPLYPIQVLGEIK